MIENIVFQAVTHHKTQSAKNDAERQRIINHDLTDLRHRLDTIFGQERAAEFGVPFEEFNGHTHLLFDNDPLRDGRTSHVVYKFMQPIEVWIKFTLADRPSTNPLVACNLYRRDSMGVLIGLSDETFTFHDKGTFLFKLGEFIGDYNTIYVKASA